MNYKTCALALHNNAWVSFIPRGNVKLHNFPTNTIINAQNLMIKRATPSAQGASTAYDTHRRSFWNNTARLRRKSTLLQSPSRVRVEHSADVVVTKKPAYR